MFDERRKLNWRLGVRLFIVAAIAFGLKFFYSNANVDQLRWVLGPTAWIVELVTGKSFAYEAHVGYMSSDHTFLIADSCSGMNFLITAFLMLSVLSIWQASAGEIGLARILTSLVAAYITTLAANSVRISTAVLLQDSLFQLEWLDPEEMHRVEGIVIYFGFLLILYVLVDRVSSNRNNRPRSRHNALRRLVLPLTVYYAFTLGIPAVNGAFSQGGRFVEHAVFVLLIPAILAVSLIVVQGVFRGLFAGVANRPQSSGQIHRF